MMYMNSFCIENIKKEKLRLQNICEILQNTVGTYLFKFYEMSV